MPGLIAVCLRPAWRTDVPLRLAPDGRAPMQDGSHPIADAAALAALHVALTLRNSGVAARVEAWCAGGAGAAEVLREALACGADAVHHWGGESWLAESAAIADGSANATAQTAAALCEPLREAAPELVLCGERSSDSGHEAFGALLAHALGSAFAHRATRVAATPEGWQVSVKLERGYVQEMTLPVPAVVTIAAQAGRPPYAALPAWLAARAAEIPCHTVAPQDGEHIAPASLLRVAVPRVKAQPPVAESLDAEARIRAMVAVETGSGGELLGPEAGVGRQAQAMLGLLQERGYLEEGGKP